MDSGHRGTREIQGSQGRGACYPGGQGTQRRKTSKGQMTEGEKGLRGTRDREKGVGGHRTGRTQGEGEAEREDTGHKVYGMGT